MKSVWSVIKKIMIILDDFKLINGWELKIAWGNPKDYIFYKWLFNFGYFGFTSFIFIFGFLIQIYQRNSIVVKESRNRRCH